MPLAPAIAIAALLIPGPGDIAIERHGESVIKVSLADAKPSEDFHTLFAPDGKTLLLRGDIRFRLVPAKELFTPQGISAVPPKDGRALLFLLDGGLLVSDEKETRIIHPDQPDRRVLESPIKAHPLLQNDLLVLSDTLLIGGTGDFWDGQPGHLLRYDLASGKVSKGAAIPAFSHAHLSPARKWIAYEFGDEESNHTHLYHLPTDTDRPVDEASIPLGEPCRTPLGWTPDNRLLVSDTIDGPVNPRCALALLDPATRKLLWHRRVPFVSFFPSNFVPIDASRALLLDPETSTVHSLDLGKGTLTRIEGLKARALSLSPDRTQLAILRTPEGAKDEGPTNAELLIARLDGSQSSVIATLPGFEPQDAYQGMGCAPPHWSPRGDLLVVPARQAAWIVKHNAAASVNESIPADPKPGTPR